ncbi:hypothetical protein EI94DRAFT_1696800 [Lactarius quietus]|nr:hypothetical protein EI94DRAFT_1696800 [Lactarius quietus]
MAALSARAGPLHAVGPYARARRLHGPRISDIKFTGPSLGAVLQPLSKQGSWYIDRLLRCWATRRARTPAGTRYGFKVLVRARGVGLSKHVYRMARMLLNAWDQTALGNIILDGQVTHAKSRSPRYLTTVLRTLRLPLKSTALSPISSPRTSSSRPDCDPPCWTWRLYAREDAGARVPFGSSGDAMRKAAAVLRTRIPVTMSRISFARHVKQLCKMSIKALYLQKDMAGTRTVVGILKEADGIEVERNARRRKSWLRQV